MIGVPELLLILVIVLILFGARRLPELGEGLGKGIKGFQKSIKGETSDSGPPRDEPPEEPPPVDPV